MRSLAEYIMRGRFQAYSIALLGGLVLILGQGAIGLVSLRRGWQEGFFVVLWACLPLLVQFWLNQIGELLTYISIAVLFTTYIGALTLRMSMSWVITLFAMIVVAGIGGILVYLSVDNLVGILQEALDKFLQNTESSIQAEYVLTGTKVTGGIAAWIGFNSTIGVLVARWLQAILYNPGGFREEFHALKLTPQVATICAVGLAASYYAGTQYEFWGVLFAVPMFFTGLGLVHNLVAAYKLGKAPLVVLYASIFIIGLPAVLIVVLGLTDTWINYRKFFAKGSD